jgi:ABC-2 type transport system permease protein
MKILAIALKDLNSSMRSFFLIGMTLAAPLLITFLIYFAFGSMSSGDTGMAPIRIGVVNADVLPSGSTLTASIGKSVRDMFFDDSVKSWVTALDFTDEAAARAAVNAQEIGVAVIIPSTFTQDYLAGGSQTQITLLQDPTLTIGPSVVSGMVRSLLDGVAGGGVAYNILNTRLAANNLTAAPQEISNLILTYTNWYIGFQKALFHSTGDAILTVTTPSSTGENSNSMQSMMGLVMAGQLIFFSFFTGAYAMMSILQESEEGTLARMFTTPTQRTIILTGKFLAVFLTVLLQGAILLAAGALIFGIHWGQPGTIALGLVGQMFASVGLGVLLVSFIKTSKQAGPIFGGGLTALGMLSGLFTTNIAMPASFTTLANLTPQGWVLKVWRLSLAGQPAGEMLVPFLVLVGMGLVMFITGAFLFRRRFA